MTPHEEAVTLLVAAYPVPSWEPATLRLYAHQVAEFPAKLVQAAVVEWLQAKPERPSVAELRAACFAMRLRWRSELRRRREAAALPPPEPDEPLDVGKLLRDTIRRIGSKG